jgi:L-2-hydroxyglutarate oxidase
LSISVLEKEGGVARHQSGRNSGVIHSGIYYTPGSLKAELCREGREQLTAFCDEHAVAYDTCGKVIVAVTAEEVPRLEQIFGRGKQNGVRCDMVDAVGIREWEPEARGVAGIHVPDVGIADYPGVANALRRLLESKGHRLVTGFEVASFERSKDGLTLRSSGKQTVQADFAINCAGLHSDRIARMAGKEPEMMIVPFRGVYYELRPEARRFCRNLIYPVPNPAYPFLGVHFTRMIDGRIEVGPNAVLTTAREGYDLRTWNWQDLSEAAGYPGFRRLAAQHWKMGLDEMHRTLSKRAYVKAVQGLVPDVRADDLLPCRSGIRAQALRSDGSMVDDFVMIDQEDALHVCNAPSPAATACLAIGGRIVDRVSERLEE